MKLGFIYVVIVLFGAANLAIGQKISVDVDNAFDFTTFKTFGWAEGQIAPKPTTSQILVEEIEKQLTARGLVRNDAAPDLRIAVMAAADIDLQGVGPSWNNERYKSWGGYGNPNALMNVNKGTLVIDLIETKSKFSIWRAVAKDIFVNQPTGNEAKDIKQMRSVVEKTVGKIFKKFPVKPRR